MNRARGPLLNHLINIIHLFLNLQSQNRALKIPDGLHILCFSTLSRVWLLRVDHSGLPTFLTFAFAFLIFVSELLEEGDAQVLHLLDVFIVLYGVFGHVDVDSDW